MGPLKLAALRKQVQLWSPVGGSPVVGSVKGSAIQV